jgi:hypothetical protein
MKDQLNATTWANFYKQPIKDNNIFLTPLMESPYILMHIGTKYQSQDLVLGFLMARLHSRLSFRVF